MVRINVAMDEATWKKLRDAAEERRIHGRASLSAVILQAIHEWLSHRKEQAGAAA